MKSKWQRICPSANSEEKRSKVLTRMEVVVFVAAKALCVLTVLTAVKVGKSIERNDQEDPEGFGQSQNEYDAQADPLRSRAHAPLRDLGGQQKIVVV